MILGDLEIDQLTTLMLMTNDGDNISKNHQHHCSQSISTFLGYYFSQIFGFDENEFWADYCRDWYNVDVLDT